MKSQGRSSFGALLSHSPIITTQANIILLLCAMYCLCICPVSAWSVNAHLDQLVGFQCVLLDALPQ